MRRFVLLKQVLGIERVKFAASAQSSTFARLGCLVNREQACVNGKAGCWVLFSLRNGCVTW